MHVSDGGANSQDFELNLAPIIDCFTVLITYLLVSASFLSLSILDVGVSANGEATPQEQQQAEIPISMEISIGLNKSVTIKISGGPTNMDMAIPVEAAGGLMDVPGLIAKVNDSIVKFPVIQEVSVTAEPGVRYKELIKLIDNLKKAIPKIYIAG